MSMPKIECAHIDLCCAASSLLQSIALEETAIAHILNAEGEKLQKAVSLSCTQKELIEINKSVEDMVDKLTTLEVVLKSKLELITSILDDCDKEHCHKKPYDKEHCDKEPCHKEPYDKEPPKEA